MLDKKTELSVNTEVFEKMAEIAAKEIDGVVSLSKKQVDLKGVLKNKSAFKGVKLENINGALEISVYICVKKGVNAKDVALKVQDNVKEKIQTMTSTAVTKVNVCVADIVIEEESAE